MLFLISECQIIFVCSHKINRDKNIFTFSLRVGGASAPAVMKIVRYHFQFTDTVHWFTQIHIFPEYRITVFYHILKTANFQITCCNCNLITRDIHTSKCLFMYQIVMKGLKKICNYFDFPEQIEMKKKNG